MAVVSKKRPAPGKPGNVVAAARGKVPPRTASRGWENAKAIGGALLIFVVLRTFFIEAFRIPSESMVPTLLVGDWLFVNNLVYGPHIPFTRVSLPGYAEPRRGEVVVFESPYQPDEAEKGNDPTPTLVKRLIGVPGDTLYMRGGVLYRNGVAQREPYVTVEREPGDDPNAVDPLFDWQKRVQLRAARFGPAPAQPTHDNWGPLVVPPASFFMMGDNRYNSKDSRYWGLVPRENVEGRPIFVYYSYDTEAGPEYLRALTEIRWRRIGHVIR
jgi:signal peptidase I